MSIPAPLRRTLAVASCLWTFGACAATTPPPRFGTVSPADPGGPEGALPAAVPVLTGQGELAEAPAGGTGSPGAASAARDHHAGPDATPAAYTCLMHPEVAAAGPGACPTCRMTLVRKAGPHKEQP